MKIGFDNERPLEKDEIMHIVKKYGEANSVESFSMTIMLPACFRDFSRTANYIY